MRIVATLLVLLCLNEAASAHVIANMLLLKAGALSNSCGSTPTPPACSSSLNFSQACNSQYVAALTGTI